MMASPVFFSLEKLGMDGKEPEVKLHSTLQANRQVGRQASRQATGWENGNLSFDLAKSFTHNPRLMSPSHFRCPSDDEAASFTDDLISFRDSLALEILGPGQHHPEVSTTEKSAVETQGYSIPIQVQEEADASPRSLSQMLDSDRQLMFFPRTKFLEDREDDEVVSHVSDSASSKLNWSLSASYSSLNSRDASREHSDRSETSDGDSGSPEVFARRRRKRRKTSRSSSLSSSSQSSRGNSLPDTHPGSPRDARLSRCSEEVSGILAEAPATPNFHDSDAECSSGSPSQDCSTDEDKIHGSSFQPLTTKTTYDRPVTFKQNTSIHGCCKPEPRWLTENLKQNYPHSGCQNFQGDEVFTKCPQRGNIWEKENVKGSLFCPHTPRDLTRHRVPVRGCNFDVKPDKIPSFTATFKDTWPALLKASPYNTNPKERLLRDPAVLTVGEVVQRQPSRSQWPPPRSRHPADSARKSWFRLENVSDLFSSRRETPAAERLGTLGQFSRSSNRSAFGTLLEDPAVLYACRENGQTTSDHQRASRHQLAPGNHRLNELIVWASCGSTTLPNDPAIIAVGKPLLPTDNSKTTGIVQY